MGTSRFAHMGKSAQIKKMHKWGETGAQMGDNIHIWRFVLHRRGTKNAHMRKNAHIGERMHIWGRKLHIWGNMHTWGKHGGNMHTWSFLFCLHTWGTNAHMGKHAPP